MVISSASWGETESEDELQKQIDETKKKLSQTKLKENTVLGSLLRTQQELDSISTNLERLSLNLGNTERRIEIIQNQLVSAQAELERIKNEIGCQKEVLNQRLIAIYKYGYQSRLEILFTAKNFAEFVTRFEMLTKYIQDDLHILKTLQAQQNAIAKKKEEILNKQQELAAQKNLYARLQVQTQKQQSRQLIAIQNRQEKLNAIQNDRFLLEEALDKLEEQSKEMESQIRGLQTNNLNILGTGKYIWPTPGTITSYFGYRIHPILRKRKYHSGLDISAPLGTKIVASDTGIVIFSGRNGGYGNMIAIDHGGGISTIYAHCSKLLVKAGETVTKNQEIGKVGSTGLSTGPHLHFEIRKDGAPVDPINY